MLCGLRAALCRKAWRLVDHQCCLVLVDHQTAGEFCGLLADFGADAFRPCIGNRLRGWHADFLPCFDTITRGGSLAVYTQLAGARPSRDDVETGVGQMPFEPTVQSDAVIFGINDKAADALVVLAHASTARPRPSPMNSASSAKSTEASA